MDFWRGLFSGDGFMPRRLCGVWEPSLIWMHIISDLVIWLAYMWIPLAMLWAYRAQKRNLQIARPLIALLLLYMTFIMACGWTHFMDALMFYLPVYRINGLIRALTGIVSFLTAVSLLRLIPQAITAPITLMTQKATLRQQQEWLRDILDAATGGVLHLCRTADDLPVPASASGPSVAVQGEADLRHVRTLVTKLAQATGLNRARTNDLVTACHEAAMNGFVHAGACTVRGFLDASGNRLQIWVEDHGNGIPLDHLPISTLKQGYSTAGTAGQGWFLILTLIDRAYLLTGAEGTRLIIEMNATPHPATDIPFSRAVGGDVSAAQFA